MTHMKFAECPCPPTEEAWEVVGVLEYVDDETGQGAALVAYECQTCGAIADSDFELYRV